MNFLPPFFRKKSKNKTPKTELLSTPKTSQKECAEDFKAFILEPILTPSALIDGGEDAPDAAMLDGQDLPWLDALEAIAPEEIAPAPFTSGTFEVGATGEITIDFLYDGGSYEGELAIFSLEGMEEYEPGSQEFITEAANRALSESEWGHIVIADREEGARFEGNLGEGNFNHGEYQDGKTLQMRPGARFGIMLVPNGTVEEVGENPNIGGSKTPLFSLSTANPEDGLQVGQIADINGNGQTFAMEDIRFDDPWHDKDYNDLIFQVRGAKGEAPELDDIIAPGSHWRETALGQEILEFAEIESDFVPVAIEEGEAIAPELENLVAEDNVSQETSLISAVEPLASPEAEEITAAIGEEIAVAVEPLWDRALETVAQQIEILQQRSELVEQMQLTFGEDWSPEQLERVWEGLRNGETRPQIEIVPQSELGAAGGYSVETNTIYLAREFLANNPQNPERIQQVLVEEIGHYLDGQFNREDSPGDEGEIFASWILGGGLSPEKLAVLKAEDDRTTRILNGKSVELELNGSFSDEVLPNGTTRLFFGEDLPEIEDDTIRIATPNADSARTAFLGNLTGWATADLESYAAGESINTLTFTAEDGEQITANLSAPHTIRGVAEGTTHHGAFPGSGENFFTDGREKDIKIIFDTPQAAVGFFGTDVGDLKGKLSLELTRVNGTKEIVTIPHTRNGTSGGALYAGIVDVENPFVAVKLINSRNSTNPKAVVDGFGYDDLIIATPEQVRSGDEIVLRELRDGKEQFTDVWETTITIPSEPSELRFDLTGLDFDFTNPNGINDAFEAILVDAEGNSLVHTIGTGRDAFFNITEEANPNLAEGVTFDGTTATVNLSFIPAGTEATLKLRLVNNDGDTTGEARIANVEVLPRTEAGEEPTVIPDVPFRGNGDIDLESLFDVSDSVAWQYGETSFNEGTQTLYTDVWLENLGNYDVDSPLLVTVTTDDPSVQVRDFDGVTPEGIPYFDFTGLIAGGTLEEGENTGSRAIAFYTPSQEPFEYEIAVIGAVNRAPEFVGEVDIEAVVGQFYEMPLVAVDEDGDHLTYRILEAPEGMDLAIDADTGAVTLQWSPNWEQEGNHGVKVEVADGRGGTDELEFVLGAVGAQPNRPPRIRSTPVVDANVKSEYVYQVLADDPDGDNLTYVLSVPDEISEDLTIDESGRIVWTPQGKHVGLHEVVVMVDDGSGGIVEQHYTIRVQPEEGNHDPIITSDPVTRISLAGKLPGKVVVAYDEEIFTDNAFIPFPHSTPQFAENLANWFTDGEPGNFLAYSDNRYITLTSLQNTLESAGHTWQTTGTLSTSEDLSQYDALFLTDLDFPSELLWDYVDGGGNVYVMAVGYNISDAERDADRWNDFLEPYGLQYSGVSDGGHYYYPTTGLLTLDNSHPLFAEVNQLYYINGNPIIDSDPDNPAGRIIGTINDRGSFAIYESLQYEYQYDVNAIDPDEDALVYSLVDAPDGIAIDSDTGNMTWEFAELPASTPVVTVKVVDGRGGEDFQTYTIDLDISSTIRGTVIDDDPRGRIVVAHDVNTLASARAGESEQKFAVNVAQWLTGENEGNLLLIEADQYNESDSSEHNFAPEVIAALENAGYSVTVTSSTTHTPEELGAFDGVFLGKVIAPVSPDGNFVDNENLVEYVNSGGNVYLYSGAGPSESNAPGEAAGWNDFLNTFGLSYVPDAYNQIATNIPITGEHPIFEGVPTLNSGNGQSILDLEPDNPQNQIIQYYNHHGTDHGVYAAFDPDTGLEGWQVYLDLDDDGVRDPNEPHTLTDAEGNYSFTGLDAGDYTVRTESKPGWIDTFPARQTFELGDNIIQNGSLEPNDYNNPGYSPPHWSVSSIDWMPGSWEASDGIYSVDLNRYEQGKVSQILNTKPETTYQVIFDLSGNPDGGQGEKPMQVRAAGQSETFIGLTRQRDDMNYQTHSWQFTTAEGQTETELEFISQMGSSYGPALDNVRVFELIPTGTESKHDVTLGQGEIVSDIDFGKRKTGEEIPNRNPEFDSNPVEVAGVGELWEYEALATDPDNDNLTYFLSVAPEGMAVNPDTGKFVWTPTLEQIGTHSVIIGVEDGNGGIDLQSFSVNADINYAPAITSVPPTTNLDIGEAYEYRVLAQDANGDDLTFSIEAPANSGMTISEEGVLQWSNPVLGDHTITITVDDGREGTDTQIITLTVDDTLTNTPPQILSEPRQSVGFGRPYIYKVEAVDADGDPLTYILDDPGLGMTIDENGWIYWTPTEIGHVGEHIIPITVKDDRGGEATQTINLKVTGLHENRNPKIVELPPNTAIVEEEYQQPITGIDPDGDVIFWNLEQAPKGLSIHPETGVLHWIPTPEQVGVHEVTVKVSDLYGGEKEETFILTVRGTNNAPIVDSIPPTLGAVGKEYRYPIFARDPEGDEIKFIGENLPDDMTLDENGVLSWTPTQTGSYEVSVVVQDELDAETTHTYTILVEENARNLPPVITSLPETYGATPNAEYRYQVTATDPEGETPTYSLVSQPDRTYGNIEIDSETGLLTWTPNEAAKTEGNHTIEIAAEDEQGLQGIQRFSLNVRENNAPVIDSTPPTEVTGGDLFRYDVKASDADGDDLRYQLNHAPEGMSIDAEGRIVWETPANLNESFGDIEVVVTDEYGATAVQAIPLQVNGDAEAPIVEIFQSLNFAYINEEVTFAVRATDNVGVEDISLTIDNKPVILDASGMVKWSAENAGNYTLLATATDKAGNISTQTLSFDVLNIPAGDDITLDIQAPNEPISDFSDLIGTVQAEHGLQSYKVEVAPVGSETFVEVFSKSDNPAEVDNGVLGEFDPTLLANGPYTLRLSATDNNGATSSIETQIEVAGDLKLGNFQLSFTDLEVPVSGIPITVTRTYDSLYAHEQDNFGYGWRLEFRDTNLQTTAPKPTPEEELLGEYGAFRDGTRVYITLPGGKRESFTFEPEPDRILGMAAGLANIPASAFHPRFVAEDGSELTLTVKDVLLSYDSDTGLYSSANPLGLPYNPEDPRFGGKYTLTTKEGIEYEIDANTGDLLQVKDLNGNTLTYSDAGIVSSTGKEVKFERDAEGRIKTAIDPQGYEIKYEYDEDGDLRKVIDREGNETELFYENGDRPHYLTRIEDPLNRDGVRTTYREDGRLEKVIDVNNKEIRLDYDPENSLQTVYDVFDRPTTYVYDSNGNVLTEIDQVGKKTDRTYNDRNEMESETITILEDDGTGNMVEVSRTTTFTYDDRGNLLTETDPLGNIQRYTYNQRGQLLTSTDPLGNTTSYTFSPRGNVLSKTDAEGNTITYTYDLRGNPLSITEGDGDVTRFRYNQFGDRIEKTDAEGTVTTYQHEYDENGKIETETTTRTTPQGEETLKTVRRYDQENNLISILDPENGLTQYQYDDNGNQTHIIDAENRVTEMKYDDKNQLIETIYPDDDTDPNNNPKASIQYDAAGNRTAIIDQEGNITTYTYDALNRPTGMLIPDDNDDINDPDSFNDNDKIEIIYNQAGQMTAMVDHRGNRSEYEYDDAGRMTLVRTFDGEQIYETKTTYDKAGRETSQTDALGRKTEYKYDKLGQLIETIFHDGTSIKNEYDAFGNLIARTDQDNKTIQYKYDALDRLIEVIDPALQSTIYRYDEAGNLIYQKDTKDQETHFEYNNLGQQTAIKRPLEPAATTTYDQVGNIKTTTDFNGDTIHYQYNEENRLIAKTLEGETEPFIEYQYHATGQLHKVEDARGETEYLYDERGLLKSRTEPDGSVISYTYNEAGLVETVTTPTGTTTYRYDEMNRLEKVIEPDPTQQTTYTYDAVGNLKTTTYPNGVVETNDYDDLNRLTGVTYKDENENVIASYEYTLDNAGNRKVVEENNGRKVEYDYDDLYRLKKEIITDPVQGDVTIEYDYDEVGNRKSMKVTTAQGTVETTYQYDKNDRLLSETTNGVTTNYTYDKNGNLTTTDVMGSLEKVEYIWDEENRLIEVNITDAEGVTQNVKYEYDAQGIRVSETVDGVTTKYLIDTVRPYAQVLEEYTGEGASRNVEASYLYGNDLISQQQGTEELFYLEDGHSGVRQLVDENGIVTDSYSYDAYGNLLGSTGTNENDYLYRGEQFDESLDLQYLRARYYDPTTGRFISTDPFEGVLEQPVSRHRYLYGNSNPVMNLDPSGLFSLQEVLVNVAMVGIFSSMYQTAISVSTELFSSSKAKTTWYGNLVTVGGKAIKKVPHPLVNAGFGLSIFDVDSSVFEYRDGKSYQYNNSIVLVFHSSLSVGLSGKTPLDVSVIVGGFVLESPAGITRTFGIGTLAGGYLSGGFGGRIAYKKVPAGIGRGVQALLMGYARGNAHGWHFGTNTELGITLDSGIAIPLPFLGERTEKTPED